MSNGDTEWHARKGVPKKEAKKMAAAWRELAKSPNVHTAGWGAVIVAAIPLLGNMTGASKAQLDDLNKVIKEIRQTQENEMDSLRRENRKLRQDIQDFLEQ